MDELIGAAVREDLDRGIAGAGIASVAASLPRRVVGNEEIAERVGVSADWIVERTGVQERRVAEPGERLTEYAADAGGAAIAAAGVEARDVDLVMVATMSHEYLTPNAAPLVATALGCERAGAIDVGAACTGFLSALALAAAQVESSRCETVLVIGADLLTRFTDPDDRSTAALFGDGAGAVVVRRTAVREPDRPRVLSAPTAPAPS